MIGMVKRNNLIWTEWLKVTGLLCFTAGCWGIWILWAQAAHEGHELQSTILLPTFLVASTYAALFWVGAAVSIWQNSKTVKPHDLRLLLGRIKSTPGAKPEIDRILERRGYQRIGDINNRTLFLMHIKIRHLKRLIRKKNKAEKRFRAAEEKRQQELLKALERAELSAEFENGTL